MTATEYRDALLRLDNELPRFDETSDPDEQIRSVLRPIVDRALRASGSSQVTQDPATCPNCGCQATSEKSPYCSVFCREQSAFVRHFRNSIANGMVFDPDRQAALGTALWSLQGGGFPRRQLMIPEKVAAKVIARDGGVCSICGSPATGVDHVGSG